MQTVNYIRIMGLRVIIMLGFFLYPSWALSVEPSEVVDKFHDVLISVMKTATPINIVSRYRELKPEIEKAFDLPFMIRMTVGRSWHKANSKQKSKLIEAFTHLSIGTYASRFNGYSGQTFETLKIRTGPKSTRLVDTLIKNPKDKSVKITYVMRKSSNQWKIIDVLLDRGISEMAVRVSEYRSILRSRGVGALATALSKKAENLLAN